MSCRASLSSSDQSTVCSHSCKSIVANTMGLLGGCAARVAQVKVELGLVLQPTISTCVSHNRTCNTMPHVAWRFLVDFLSVSYTKGPIGDVSSLCLVDLSVLTPILAGRVHDYAIRPIFPCRILFIACSFRYGTLTI